MSFAELLVAAIGIIIIVTSWIINAIREQAEQRNRGQTGQQTGGQQQGQPDLDEIARRRKEQLRELARQRQQKQAPDQYRQRETPAGYARYRQHEERQRPAETYSRYRQTEQGPAAPDQDRYRQAEGQAPEEKERYTSHQSRRPERAGDQIAPGQPRTPDQPTQRERRTEPRPESERQAIDRQIDAARRGQQAQQPSRPDQPHRETDTGPAESPPMQREARMRQATAAGGAGVAASAAAGQAARPTATAKRLRRILTGGNVRDVFLVKELLDKPLALREEIH